MDLDLPKLGLCNSSEEISAQYLSGCTHGATEERREDWRTGRGQDTQRVVHAPRDAAAAAARSMSSSGRLVSRVPPVQDYFASRNDRE